MRSRPDLKVFLSPHTPIGGQEFAADLRMFSRSDTPCDGMFVQLVGEERRYLHTTGVGSTSHAVYAERSIVSLGATIEPFRLTVGEHRRVVRFALPVGSPPAYTSSLTRIQYALHVRIVIPWWPDRREQYAVPVTIVAAARGADRPRTYCSNDGGPRAGQLYFEASFDHEELEVGGKLNGAVSLSNVDAARIRRVEASFLTFESPLVASSTGRTEVARYTAVILPVGPKEGASIPFALRLPKAVPPTFYSPFVQVSWALELRAVVAFGSDVSLTIPITLVTHKSRDEIAVPTPRVAPIGRDRRALVWAEAARLQGFDFDAKDLRERISGTVGGVSIEIEPEQRDDGAWSVAHLRWPTLGLDLRVAERRWIDAVRGEVKLDADDFTRRFTTRAREAEQARDFLGPLAEAIGRFVDVALDDEGCVLAIPGAGFSVEAFTPFLVSVRALARAIDVARGKVLPPLAFADRLDRWRDFADSCGGRLVVGSMSLAGCVVDSERFDVVTRWDDATPVGVTVRFQLGAHEPPRRELVTEIAGPDSSFSVEHGILFLEHPTFDDPREIVALVRALAPLLRAARGEREGGPYR